MPAGLGLPPDRLAERQGGLNRRRGTEEEHIPGDRPAVIVEDDGQPRLPGLALTIFHEDVELAVIRLPDGVGRFGLPAVDQVEAVAVRFRALVRQRDQRGVHSLNHEVDGSVTWNRFAQPRCHHGRLAVHRGCGRARLLQREPLNKLLERGGHLPFALIGTGLAAQPRQPALAIVLGPAVHRAHAQMILLSNADKRDAILQVRADDLKSLEGKARSSSVSPAVPDRVVDAILNHIMNIHILSHEHVPNSVAEKGALLLLEPTRSACSQQHRSSKTERLPNSVAEKLPNSDADFCQIPLQ